MTSQSLIGFTFRCFRSNGFIFGVILHELRLIVSISWLFEIFLLTNFANIALFAFERIAERHTGVSIPAEFGDRLERVICKGCS